jgi:hypothetical protein
LLREFPEAAEVAMRVALFAFNLLALAALLGPAMLIVAEVDAVRLFAPRTRELFYLSLGAGALAGVTAAAGLSRGERGGFQVWTTLAGAALLLIGATVGLALSW